MFQMTISVLFISFVSVSRRESVCVLWCAVRKII